MNILFVSPFFHPEPISTGKYNTDFVKSLVSAGHEVDVICSHPVYPDWKVSQASDTLLGVTIHRGGAFVIYPRNQLLRRLVLELWFFVYVFFRAAVLSRRADQVVFVFPPSLAFLGLVPFRRRRRTFVGIVHDLQAVHIHKKSSMLAAAVRFGVKVIERAAFKRCDSLIFLSNEMRETAAKVYGLDEQKLKVQYPFSNIGEMGDSEELSRVLPSTHQHVVYSGALGEKQNPDVLYRFFDIASGECPETMFHCFSAGAKFEELKRKNKNPRIQFHDLVEKRNLRELYERSTVQIVPQKPRTSNGSLPSKLPNLMLASCQILIITDPDSELEALSNDFGIGKTATSWDLPTLVDILKSQLRGPEMDFVERRKLVAAEFSIESLIEKVLA